VVNVFDIKPLDTYRCGFESVWEFWTLACEEAIQQGYGRSVVLIECLLVPDIMHRGTSEVFLYHYKAGKWPYELNSVVAS
jgi:hypothetical protein